MRKTYSYDKLSIRNIDLHYQFADGGETWYQCKGIYAILGIKWKSRRVDSISAENKRVLDCGWIHSRPIAWFVNMNGMRELLNEMSKNKTSLSVDGQKGYTLLQLFVRQSSIPMPQSLPMPQALITAGPVQAAPASKPEPVNTEADIAGLNVTPDAMARKMSSREIAELTGKNHKDVLRDIRTLENQGAITGRNFALSEYRDASGKSNPEYLLDFDATMTLVTGYNAVLRAKVIRRWRELETGEAKPAMPKAPEPAPCKTWGDNNMPTAAMLEEFRAWKGVAVECGLDNNAACISANGVLDRNYGVSPLQIARIQLTVPGNEQEEG